MIPRLFSSTFSLATSPGSVRLLMLLSLSVLPFAELVAADSPPAKVAESAPNATSAPETKGDTKSEGTGKQEPSNAVKAEAKAESGGKSIFGNLVSSFNLGGGENRSFSALPSLAPMVEKLLPAVVNISTQQTVSRRMFEIPQFPQGSPFEHLIPELFEGYRWSEKPRKITSLGSGFVIDSEGYIVTNNHVIADADEITVILSDETELKAKIVGRDHRTDLALLKVEAPYKLPYIEWGDSTKARVGDWIVAIGNPFGLGGSVTAGIISARARDISRARAGAVTDYIDDFIQTDASINVGNSGGPMFDMHGRVIGINTAILSPNGTNIGIGFAIPASVARPVVEQLKQYGRTKRGWIGVHIQRVSPDIAENLGLGNPRGALVGRVATEGPAAKAGLKTWDVILKFDNVSILDPRKLTRVVGDTPVGKKVEVVVWRNHKEETFTVTVGQLEEPEDDGVKGAATKAPKQQTLETLGLIVATITPDLRAQLDIKPDMEGVLVVDVKPNSPAASKRLRPDDIIVEVERKPTRTVEDLAAVVEEAVKTKKKSILIQFYRDDQPGFEALKLEAGETPKDKK